MLKKLLLSLLITPVFTFLVSHFAYADSITLKPSMDAGIRQVGAGNNFGRWSEIVLGMEPNFENENQSLRASMLIKFDLSGIPAGSIIGSAKFYLKFQGRPDTQGYYIYRNAQGWSEYGVTWNTRPATGSPRFSLNTSSGNIGTYLVDITSLVKSWVAGDYTNYGIHITPIRTSGDFWTTVYSREANEANQPRLVVSYTKLIVIDVIKPNIQNVTARNISSDRAKITWTTNEASDSFVAYGSSLADLNTVGQSDSVTVHEVNLTNLSSGTVYYYQVKSKDRAGNQAVSQVYNFTTNVVIARTPRLSNVMHTDVTANSAKIRWTTDIPSSSFVYTSTTANENTDISQYDDDFGQQEATTNHVVTLNNLNPATTYQYRAISEQDERYAGISVMKSFTTFSVSQNPQGQGNTGEEVNNDEGSQGDGGDDSEAHEGDGEQNQNSNGANEGSGETANSGNSSGQNANSGEATSIEEVLKDKSSKKGKESSSSMISNAGDNLVSILPFLLARGAVPMVLVILFLGLGVVAFVVILVKGKSVKLLVCCGCVFVALAVLGFIFLSVLPFAESFLYSTPFYFRNSENDVKMEKLLKEDGIENFRKDSN